MLRTTFTTLLVAAALSLTACGDDYGESCDLPESGTFQAFCDEEIGEAGSTSATCVFTNSTQCESRMCARYIGSRDFCTVDCDPEDANSCPSGSTCHTIPSTDLAFCVPPGIEASVN